MNYNEILTAISKIKTIDSYELHRVQRQEWDALKANGKRSENPAEYKKLDTKHAKQRADNDNKATIKGILRNNLRVVIFRDLLPEWLEVLKKYSGKSCGEKTRDKINKELQAVNPDIMPYISNDRLFYHLTNKPGFICHPSADIYCNYNVKIIDNNNKIAAAEQLIFENFYIYDNNYIDDPGAHIENMQQLKDEIKQLESGIYEKIKEYNAGTVGTFRECKQVYLGGF